MNRLRARVFTAFLTGLVGAGLTFTTLLSAPLAQAEDSAIEAFKAKHETVVKLVKERASDDKIQAKVDGLLDYDWLAKAALGGPDNFSKVCGERCDEFEELLTKLIRENYLRMIRKAEKHPVEYVGQVAGRNGLYKVTTRVKIQKNGREQTVTVDYVMHKVDGTWHVRDIITDDVSLARTYQYEFNKIAKAEGIGGIISKLEEKLAKLGA
ncbi:ABC transporter substrate-binding protein [Pseudenhygromyxa sp. WMMC2535]|uniref:MlaC/ttg2D family ABC transporter substrate-binding protein n=1 Tax=Pseudenhygromyxa sp. WMMC2535 TaxID=2712867 RepID=UPI001551BAD1|nr:ABC transporter substrate-binding protein [Pseudenhygromyxa sp. WMMC2535]NVB41787.1 ABC transporter substrate-binding protein [Pseudenhygromyxa sp. WMMC2535]